mmetsp:Transcript_102917/g.268701  ORF Transcript_102917/g.268701 Transcript_102917/m.268701 type:complete len:242 (+) Transcript_102917:533-1258(+)
MAASALSIFACSASIFSTLFDIEASVLLTSRSHQALCLSSSVCSSERWKIIFWIMLLTSSKGPATCAAISSARRPSAFERSADAWVLSSCTALSRAPLGERSRIWKKSVASSGDAGGTGLLGASVRTPAALARISAAFFIASSSRARAFCRSAHWASLTLHFLSVSESSAESACRSSCVLVSSPSSSPSAPCTSDSSADLASFAFCAAPRWSARAALASSYALTALVSAFVVSSLSFSNFC